jgi:hypothetical protein
MQSLRFNNIATPQNMGPSSNDDFLEYEYTHETPSNGAIRRPKHLADFKSGSTGAVKGKFGHIFNEATFPTLVTERESFLEKSAVVQTPGDTQMQKSSHFKNNSVSSEQIMVNDYKEMTQEEIEKEKTNRFKQSLRKQIQESKRPVLNSKL